MHKIVYKYIINLLLFKCIIISAMYICPNANECVEGCYTLLFSLIVDIACMLVPLTLVVSG